jgi:serine/threonine protein kinase
MPRFDDKTEAEIMDSLEQKGFPFSRYMLCRTTDGRPKQLGKGSYSVVYEMADRNFPEKHYALKVMGMEKNAVTTEEFKKTVDIQNRLSRLSEHVVGSLDTEILKLTFGPDKKIAAVEKTEKDSWGSDNLILQFELMELLESILYKDKFKKVTLLRKELGDTDEILKLARQIGDAVQKAHSNNILHRDIKLENILWDPNSKVYKLADFGIARYVESGCAETVVYTDGYGAPEVAVRMLDNYNLTADIYSFGIVLYLLFNDLKFPGSEGYYAVGVQYTEQFEFPAPENATEELAGVIRQMCQYHRECRYQTMTDAVSALENAAKGKRQEYVSEVYTLLDNVTEICLSDKKGRNPADHVELDDIKIYMDKYNKKMYRKSYVGYIIGFSVLFMLFVMHTQTFGREALSLGFWSVPIAAVIESGLIELKEDYVFGGVATAILAVYSIYATGIFLPQAVVLICMVTGIPVICASAGIGTILWMVIEISGKTGLIQGISDHTDWIVLILLFYMTAKAAEAMDYAGKDSKCTRKTEDFCEWLPVISFAAGIVVLILKYAVSVPVPDEIVRIPMVVPMTLEILIYLIDVLKRKGNRKV